MSKTPRLRYTSEKQILDLIDRAILRSHAALVEADEKDREAAEIYKSGKELMFDRARSARRRADVLRRRATRIMDDDVKRLGRKLAEFRTETIPEVTMDRSVQA